MYSDITMKIFLVIFSFYYTSCGEDVCTSGMCRCLYRHVYCNDLNISYIPTLPAPMNRLTMDGNRLPVLDHKVLQNITDTAIVFLSLKNCELKLIKEDTFRHFKHLTALRLSNNNLTIKSLYTLMSEIQIRGKYAHLHELQLQNIGLKTLPRGLFKDTGHLDIAQLDISQNSIEILNFTEFKPLQTLKQLDVGYNHISSITDLVGIRLLSRFSMKSNYLTRLPNFCDGSDLFPNLVYLDIRNNTVFQFNPQNLDCLQKLQILILSQNCISDIKSGFFHNFKSLQELDLSLQVGLRKQPMQIEKYAFNNSQIKMLTLDNSQIRIDHVSSHAFRGCPNLKNLNLAISVLSDFQAKHSHKLSRILSTIPSLENLDLTDSNLYFLPTSFKNLPNLTSLSLSRNHIVSWSAGFWAKNKKLKRLHISNNLIKSMKKEMFPVSFRKQIKSISLGYNHVECKCDNVWFINWIRQNTSLFHDYPKGYTCLNMTDRVCLINTPLYTSITGVCSILLSIFILISLVYKYRWFIKYQIYIWRHQPKILENMARREFIYDIFVSYCAQDSNWVMDYIVPNLENDENKKLCIHERDFLPGRMIIDNIVEAIENSRRVLIVLSNSFAKSEWCQFELTLAQKHVLNLYIEPLTVVLLEDIDAENMSNSLHALLKTTTYITWYDDLQYNYLFWQRLKNSLENHL